jgi:hypothetical protein
MTTAQLLKIHHEMEQRNRARIEAHKNRKPIIGQKVTADRKAFREFLKTRTA